MSIHKQNVRRTKRERWMGAYLDGEVGFTPWKIIKRANRKLFPKKQEEV
jgi:hypothetical protein